MMLLYFWQLLYKDSQTLLFSKKLTYENNFLRLTFCSKTFPYICHRCVFDWIFNSISHYWFTKCYLWRNSV